jgi:hypothetical protein
MSKPNGDNRLTRELLQLRGSQAKAEPPPPEAKEFEVSVRVKGPDFELDVSAKGAAWIIRKVLQDLDTSIEQLW